MKTRRHFRPRFDLLETRLVPACVLNQLDTDGNGQIETLQFIGDELRQVLNITDNAFQDHTIVSLDCNGDGDFTDVGDMNAQQLGEFRRFDFQMGAGDDEINYGMNQGLVGDTRKIFVRLGAGTNRFNHTGSSNIDFSSFKFKILDSVGADTIDIQRNGLVSNSTFKVLADLGDAADVFILGLPQIFQNASVCDVDVLLGSGNNTLTLNAGLTRLLDTSLVDVDVLGGGLAGETDTVNGQMRFDLEAAASRAFVDILLGGGNDQLDMTYASNIEVSGAELRVNVKGDAGNDTIKLTSIDAVADPGLLTAGLLDLRLNGGTGNDTVVADFDAEDGFNVTGTFRFRGKGGAGTDTVRLDLEADATSTGTVDVRLLGLDADDTLNLTCINLAGANINFGPLAAILLDGGTGTDTSNTTLTGTVPVQEVSCEV